MSRLLIGCLIIGALAAGALSTSAADKKPKKSPAQRFARMDVNKDGKLSPEEFLAKRAPDKKEVSANQFKKRDKNQDGALSLDEFKAAGKGKKNLKILKSAATPG